MNSQFAGSVWQNSQFDALSDPQETGNLRGAVDRLRRLSPSMTAVVTYAVGRVV